jgi:hypothetical protein
MINLLPPDYKRELVKEYRLRLVAVVLTLIASALSIGVLFTIPSFFVVYSQERLLKKEQQAQNFATKNDTTDIERALQASDRRVSLLESRYNRLILADILGLILEKKNAGITLTSFQYEYGQGGIVTLVLMGVAQTREGLVSFEHALEGEQKISSVQLPISDLAASVDIEFTMNLKLEEAAIKS